MNLDLIELPLNSVDDLAVRWRAARFSAFKNSSHPPMNSEDEYLGIINSGDEAQFDELLKRVFLNSRSLGMSYQKTFGLVWDLGDIARFSRDLRSPCLQGTWEHSASARQLTRSGCTGGSEGGLRECQYWREAIDGLVTGLCENERFVRHECVAAGNSQCVDVF